MRIITICLSLLFLQSGTYAQSSFSLTKDWNLVASYFGNNLWNPGLQISGEKVFKEKINTRTYPDKVKNTYIQHVLDARLGFYIDNPTHWAIHNNFNYNFRRVKSMGKFRTLGIGAGYIRTFLPETYEVKDNGDVTQVKNPGRLYFTPVFTIGVGRLWKRKSAKPWQLKVHNFWLFNYNNGTLPQIHIEYGYIFGYNNREKEVRDDI